MANAETVLAGSTSATDVVLRNADDGSLRIMTGSTPTEVMKIPVGGIPAFRAYRSGSNQSLSSGVSAKVQLNSESYDTASAFDSTTNYRFQPTVAGYYAITGGILAAGTNITQANVEIRVTTVQTALNYMRVSATSDFSVQVSDIVLLNGSTDYVELWATITGTSPVVNVSSIASYMSGVLVRAT